MFIREVLTKKIGKDENYSSFKLVKSIRENGQPKQIILLNLGSLQGLTRFLISDNALQEIKKECINDGIFNCLNQMIGQRFYSLFDLKGKLSKYLNKIDIDFIVPIIIDHINVFRINCKLLASRIEELYTNQPGLFESDKEIEELAGFYHRKLMEKSFNKEKEVILTKDTNKSDYQELDINSFVTDSAYQIGGEFLCFQAINELGLASFFSQTFYWKEPQINTGILAIISKLLNPGTENMMTRWLNQNSGAFEFYPLKSGQINKDYLYQASLMLYNEKDKILKFISNKVDDIFNLESKIILYDLTNTHFEGAMKESEKARYGRNKQKRSDCKQITLALITDEHGFCRHSRYYTGNVGETTTLKEILEDIINLDKSLLKGSKPCIIMDAGFASEENLKELLRCGFDYITVSRSSHSELIKTLDYESLVSFKNKSEDTIHSHMFEQLFEYEDNKKEKQEIKESILYVMSPQKEAKEKSMDKKKCDRFEKGLILIQKTIINPRGQKEISKIHQRLGRLKERNAGIVGYFKITTKDDGKNITFFEWEKIQNIAKKKKQGTYFIRTSIEQKQEEKIWYLYRTINQIEETFKELKSDFKMRPNHHHKDNNIEAHINLCIVAYQIANFIRYRLSLKGIKHNWSEIRRIMSTQKYCLSAINKRNGTIWIKSCTRPIASAIEIYKAMGYKNMPYYRKSISV